MNPWVTSDDVLPPPGRVVDGLAARLNVPTQALRFESIPGAPHAARVHYGSGKSVFLRWDDLPERLSDEASRLQTLLENWTIRVPNLLHQSADPPMLVLEAIPAERLPSAAYPDLGRRLARCHRNGVGATLDVAGHYRHRMEQAFDRAIGSNRISPCIGRKAITILHRWDRWFDDVETESVLVHGDLRPDHVFAFDGEPVLVSPRSEWGSREIDVALLAPEPEGFAQGYRSEWPLPAGYDRRRWLYRLIVRFERLNEGRSSGDAVDSCIASFIANS